MMKAKTQPLPNHPPEVLSYAVNDVSARFHVFACTNGMVSSSLAGNSVDLSQQ